MDFKDATPVAFVYVSDLARALDFYSGTLGLESRGADDYGCFVVAGGGLVRITVIPDNPVSPHPVFGLKVGDIAGAVAALAERGVAFTPLGGNDPIWASPDGLSKMAFFADPDGNALMLHEGD